MYCPQCSAHNEVQQKYCRQCGLPLSSVQLTLEGRTDEAIAKYKNGANLISASVVTLGVCALAALANNFLSSGPWNYGVIINLILGLLITLPMIVAGFIRLSQAERLILSKELPRNLKESRSEAILPAASRTDSELSPSLLAHSITEQTTLHLKQPEEKRYQ